jgi:acetyl/propionyl-CoA carboxylase alpha subunit
MLAKLIVHAPTRAEAIQRMRRALVELRIVGIETSVPFHIRVMDEPDFVEGTIDIEYLPKHENLLLGAEPDERLLRQAAVAAALLEEEARGRRAASRQHTGDSSGGNAWRGRTAGWRGR